MMTEPSAPAAAASAEKPHPPGYRARRFRNWFFLGLLYAGYYLCRYNFSTVNTEIAKEYGLNNQQVGAISSGRDIGYAVGQFVNGLFADALGGKQSMAIGAIGTIILNLVFYWYSTGSFLDLAVLVTGFTIIRTLDGYAQSFGAPGMVKVNAAWFRRRERGAFAGVFGTMIQMGQLGVIRLSKFLMTGGPIALFGVILMIMPQMNWRTMFVVPPIIIAVLTLLMWINVRNHPEQAGYAIEHDDDAKGPKEDPTARLPVLTVFARIAANPLIWVNAGAYLCTGFVRRAYDSWWAKYLDNTWGIGKDSPWFEGVGYALVVAAVVGSMGAGYLSDKLFKSRRSPVAAALYGLESLVILAAVLVLTSGYATAGLACVFLTLISLTCNTSHSIIGTAAVMDIGGRRMAGFALGIVNSCQYVGGVMAGYFLGGLLDKYGWNALFWSMLPFSLLGTALMAWTAYRTHGRDVKGA